ncbi:hypothetical protein BH18ACT4_BH18ACT4_09970 [soil metagenome]
MGGVAGYRLALLRPTLFAYQLVCTARRPVFRGDG